MTFVALRSSRYPRLERRRRRNRAILGVSLVTLTLLGAQIAGQDRTEPHAPESVATAPEAALTRSVPADHAWMLDPSPILGGEGSRAVLSTPLSPGFHLPAPAAQPIESRSAEAQKPTLSEPEQLAVSVPLPIPLPVPRPPEFRREPVTVTARLTRRPVMPSTQSVFRAARSEEPSLFDRIFGDSPAPSALGYAAVDPAPEDSRRSRLVPAPVPSDMAGTAVYDITAQRVTLPSGEVLEAHSGLGPSMDNPRNVHLTMRGSTPPGIYDLREREALFHGVRAIRLNPVGGPAAIHGRVGLLAHTYMLGPSGASNGCVVFRDYHRFLQAYLRGEIRRLVVVAGNGQDGPPANGRRYGMAGRSARGG